MAATKNCIRLKKSKMHSAKFNFKIKISCSGKWSSLNRKWIRKIRFNIWKRNPPSSFEKTQPSRSCCFLSQISPNFKGVISIFGPGWFVFFFRKRCKFAFFSRHIDSINLERNCFNYREESKTRKSNGSTTTRRRK